MAGVLPATLRAASPFKIAPGDFVDHSGTSPSIAPVGQRIVRNGNRVDQN